MLDLFENIFVFYFTWNFHFFVKLGIFENIISQLFKSKAPLLSLVLCFPLLICGIQPYFYERQASKWTYNGKCGRAKKERKDTLHFYYQAVKEFCWGPFCRSIMCKVSRLWGECFQSSCPILPEGGTRTHTHTQNAHGRGKRKAVQEGWRAKT